MAKCLKDLFDSKSRVFEIPPCQRAFSWDFNQINQLIEDLKRAQNYYFLGHFIFETRKTNAFFIIDGQQRLTTCVIFFSALKEFLQGKKDLYTNQIDLERLEDYYLKDNRTGTQKLKTVSYDNNYFLDEIIEGKTNSGSYLDTASKIRLKDAKRKFIEAFEKHPIHEVARWVNLLEAAQITTFVAKTKTQATQVFSFQNDRGKKLTNLEKVKAFLMQEILLAEGSKRFKTDLINYLENSFSEVYKQLERITLHEDEALNYFWRSFSQKGFRAGDICLEVREEICAISNGQDQFIKNLVSGLSDAFKTVERIEKAEEQVFRDLLYLDNMALAYPFLIRAARLGCPPDKISRLARMLENIIFRYLLRGGRAEIESRLNSRLAEFKSADQLDQVIDKTVGLLLSDPWWGYWSDLSMDSHLNGYMYGNRVDNYLLWKYELHIADKDHPKPHLVSFDDLIRDENIEHIAPQVPTNGDPIANGYGLYEDLLEPQIGIASGNWLNSIGNLMLISGHHNRVIGNKEFRLKLDSYGNNNLLNQQKEICSFASQVKIPIYDGEEIISEEKKTVWDVESIKRRKKKIIEAANLIWDLKKI